MANDKPKYPFPTLGFSLVSTKGEATGKDYTGNFEAKERLTMRDFLQKDSLRRSLLGDRPESATAQAQVYAEALAHCSVSLVDVPVFWRDSQGGLDLYDDNIVFDVYNKVIEGQTKVNEADSKKGEDAKAELRKVVKKKDVAPE